jgi:hypothetical protein
MATKQVFLATEGLAAVLRFQSGKGSETNRLRNLGTVGAYLLLLAP